MNRPIPRSVIIDNQPVSVDVTTEVQTALDTVIAAHADDIDAALAPFGLGIYDLLPTRYRRIVRAEEVDNPSM